MNENDHEDMLGSACLILTSKCPSPTPMCFVMKNWAPRLLGNLTWRVAIVTLIGSIGSALPVIASDAGAAAASPVPDDCCGKFAVYEDPIPGGPAQQPQPFQLRVAPYRTASLLAEPNVFSTLEGPATFSNTTPITITDCPNPCPATGQAASLFPSVINVAGVPGVIERVSVTITGLSHAFPADTDFLLVSPSGRATLLMSDFGAGSPGVSNITVKFDDYATTPIPSTVTGNTGNPFVSGTYRPANSGTTDQFPAPAPVGPYKCSLSHFNGDNPNGQWRLFVIDDANLDGGSISGGWSITFDKRPPAPKAGDILISEFRTRGAGTTPPGSDGSADEFIELYNNTDESITIIDSIPGADPTSPADAGWRIATAQGAAAGEYKVIPQTSSVIGPLAIPPRGHFLITTQPTTPSPAGNTYSLSAYPTGTGITASGTTNFTIDPQDATVGFMSDTTGLAIFSTAEALPVSLMDSVGFSPVVNSLYKEGAGISSDTGVNTPAQHSWVRKTASGTPLDTNNNADDFQLVETTGATLAGISAALGAPGPERTANNNAFTTTSSPIFRADANNMTVEVIDPQQAFGIAPNAIYNSTPVTNGTNGTIKLRAKITNNGPQGIIALRYRVVTLSTLTGGAAVPGQADLRVLDSPAQVFVLTDASNVQGQALTVQTPAAQLAGGGLNTSLSEGVITTTAPLTSGSSTVVEFNLGVVQFGNFRFGVIAEGLNTRLQGVSGQFFASGSISDGMGGLSVSRTGSANDTAFTAAKKIVVIDVLANDSQSNGDAIIIIAQPKYGTVTVVDGKIRYAPKAALPTTGDTFRYSYNGVAATVDIVNLSTIAGSYDGLAEDPAAGPGREAHERAGRVQVTITKNGTYSGTLSLGGVKRSGFKGALSGIGTFSNSIKRVPEAPIALNFQVNGTGTSIGSTLQSTDYASNSFTYALDLDRKTAATAQNHILFISPDPTPNTPQGTGFASTKISAKGDVTLTGKLPEGTPFTSAGFLHADGVFPIYSNLYSNALPKGSLRANMQFATQTLLFGEAEGIVDWFKPARPNDTLFPDGFTVARSALLASYVKPASGIRALAFDSADDNGHLVLADGGFAEIDQIFTLGANNKATPTAPIAANVTLKLNAATGLFTGTFINPGNSKKTTFQGALLQDLVKGFGFFTGAGATDGGSVLIEKKP